MNLVHQPHRLLLSDGALLLRQSLLSEELKELDRARTLQAHGACKSAKMDGAELEVRTWRAIGFFFMSIPRQRGRRTDRRLAVNNTGSSLWKDAVIAARLSERNVRYAEYVAKHLGNDAFEDYLDHCCYAEMPASLAQAYALARIAKRDPEMLREVLATGLAEINEAIGHAKLAERNRIHQELHEHPPVVPAGTFSVLCVDPPWKYDEHDEINDYPSLPVEEIIARTPVIEKAAEDSVLWLWATNRHLPFAFQCIESWGFEYSGRIVTWDKGNQGLGTVIRHVTEHCLIATKGKPTFTPSNWTSLIREPKRENSRKPLVFFEMVESLCPGKKLEMYARQQRPGWAVWGNETTKFDQVGT